MIDTEAECGSLWGHQWTLYADHGDGAFSKRCGYCSAVQRGEF